MAVCSKVHGPVWSVVVLDDGKFINDLSSLSNKSCLHVSIIFFTVYLHILYED